MCAKNISILTFLLISLSAVCHAKRVLNIQPLLLAKSLNSNSRIVYGYEATAGQFPHQVCLFNRRSDSKYTLCGGSIISDEYILTCAHCVTNIVSTTISFATVNRDFPTYNLEATEKIVHENFNAKTLNNDIALWKLPKKISFTDNIKPIALPRLSQVNLSFENEFALVSGYGRTEASTTTSRVLRYAPVKVIANKDCEWIYGSHVVTESTLCTIGNEMEDQGPCNGDSGSPLTLKDNGEDVLIGVASFVNAYGCGNGKPSGYVRTSMFLSWIESNAGVNIVP